MMTFKEKAKYLLELRRHITPNGCWEYVGYIALDGYGYITVYNKRYIVHRLAAFIYKDFNLSSKNLICHNPTCSKKCFNPEHIREDNYKGNRLDSKQIMSDTWGAKANKIKIHCPQGHEYNLMNTKIGSHNDRICKECHKIKNRDYARRIRAERRSA